jgi:hypothetical protein
MEGAGATEGDSPVDAGTATTATLSGFTPGTKVYVAVTAYDVDADEVGDWFDGNESWLSEEVALQVGATCHNPHDSEQPPPGATV